MQMSRVLELAKDKTEFGQHQVEAGAEPRAVAELHAMGCCHGRKRNSHARPKT